jgi:hypothetical protein
MQHMEVISVGLLLVLPPDVVFLMNSDHMSNGRED